MIQDWEGSTARPPPRTADLCVGGCFALVVMDIGRVYLLLRSCFRWVTYTNLSLVAPRWQ